MDAPRALRFAADAERLTPVVALGGAIVLDLPAFVDLFHNAISPTSAVERLLIAYVFALLASRLISVLLVRYAHDAVRRDEEAANTAAANALLEES
jgi:hypothetical protein